MSAPTAKSFHDTHPSKRWRARRPPTKKQILRYNQALGAFINSFTHVEGLIAEELWAVADIENPVAQALFSGLRVDQAMSLLTRTMDAKGMSGEGRDTLELIFGQLRIINKVRNEIVHHGAARRTRDIYLVSNLARAHIPSVVRITTISPRLLDLMTLDLHVMGFLLGARTLRRLDDQVPRKMRRDWDELLVLLDGVKQLAWLYKPKPLAPPRRRIPKTPPKQPRLPS